MTEFPSSLSPQQILEYLPHRYPFLLIDRIEQIRGDEFCVGIKNVTFNEPCFQGHFPGRPVMPGVLLLQGMAQTASSDQNFNPHSEARDMEFHFRNPNSTRSSGRSSGRRWMIPSRERSPCDHSHSRLAA